MISKTKEFEGFEPFEDLLRGENVDTFGDPEKFRKFMDEVAHFDDVKKYLDLQDELLIANDYRNALGEIVSMTDEINPVEAERNWGAIGAGILAIGAGVGGIITGVGLPLGLASAGAGIALLTTEIYGYQEALKEPIPLDQLESLNEYIKDVNKNLKEGEVPFQNLDLDSTIGDIASLIDKVSTSVIDADIAITKLNETINLSQIGFQYFKSGIDTMFEDMRTYQDDILQLEFELQNLRREVSDPYKTQSIFPGMGEFEGTMNWQIAVTEAEMQLDRFAHTTQMAIKYGYEYDGEMADVVATLANYTTGQREATDALNAHNLAIKRNNLEMMKIQLKGLESRHGLRRGDQIKMKNLQIANLKERIAMTTTQLGLEEDVYDSHYQDALYAYNKYIAEQRYNLWQLKDTRESDIKDLRESLEFKKGLLEKYIEWYGEKTGMLTSDYLTMMNLMTGLATTPGMEDSFMETFSLEGISGFLKTMKDFAEVTGFELPELDADTQVKADMLVDMMDIFDKMKKPDFNWADSDAWIDVQDWVDTYSDLFVGIDSLVAPDFPDFEEPQFDLNADGIVTEQEKFMSAWMSMVTGIANLPCPVPPKCGTGTGTTPSGELPPYNPFNAPPGSPLIIPRITTPTPTPPSTGGIPRWKFAGGTNEIPKDMWAYVHKGEQISPKGDSTIGGGSKTVNVRVDPITMSAVLKDETDLQSFGSKIGRAIAAGFVGEISSEFEVG